MKQHTRELARAERKAREGERQLQRIATALQAEQARLALSEERFRHAFLHSGIATGVTTTAGIVSNANPALRGWLQYPGDTLIGADLHQIAHSDSLPALREGIAQLLGGTTDSLRMEAKFLRRCGQPVWAALSCTAVPDTDGQATLLIHHFQDLTSRREAEAERDRLLAQLTQQASHDGLTGLLNRTAFEERLQAALHDAHPPGTPLHALCFLDLDGFKQVNDRAGHAAGDALLRQIADVLRQGMRHTDAVARVGGDEFALLLHHCPQHRAMELVNGLIRQLEAMRFAWNGSEFRVGASAGVCPLDPARGDLNTLMQQADMACYAAKRAGGGQTVASATAQAPAAALT